MKKVLFVAIALTLMAVGCKNNSKAPKVDVNTVDTTVVYEDSTWVDCSCADEDSTVVEPDSLAENIADGLAELVLLTLDEE